MATSAAAMPDGGCSRPNGWVGCLRDRLGTQRRPEMLSLGAASAARRFRLAQWASRSRPARIAFMIA